MSTTTKKIIIFGASQRAKNIYKLLMDWTNWDVLFFADNDSKKWGTSFCGKEVRDPKELPSYKEDILIASTYEDEIMQQLFHMGMSNQAQRAQDVLCRLRKAYFESTLNEYLLKKEPFAISHQHTVIFDTLDGVGWGGTEIWSYRLAKGLKKAGIPILIFGTTEQALPGIIAEGDIKRINMGTKLEKNSYEKVISELVMIMASYLPLIAIDNWNEHFLIAAHILKKQFPEQVTVLSVQHNDFKDLYQKQQIYQDYIDLFFCVSSTIQKKLSNLYGIPKQKVLFKETMVDFDFSFTKSYSTDTDVPLRIGYAARLESIQKRADLLPQFIEELEKREINYLLEIAGDGTQKELIERYIGQHNLENHVKVIGLVPKEKMGDFWKKQDLFLNISEYEGTSLSMLEAMSFGIIPIVTNVSGVSDFIQFGKNGYFCEVNQLGVLADAIKKIDGQRNLLPRMGQLCRNQIKSKCQEEDYINYFKEFILTNK